MPLKAPPGKRPVGTVPVASAPAFRFVSAEPFSAGKVPPAVRLPAVRLVRLEPFSAGNVPPAVRLPAVFFFNDTPTSEIYALSLLDALPIWLVIAEPSSAA